MEPSQVDAVILNIFTSIKPNILHTYLGFPKHCTGQHLSHKKILDKQVAV